MMMKNRFRRRVHIRLCAERRLGDHPSRGGVDGIEIFCGAWFYPFAVDVIEDFHGSPNRSQIEKLKVGMFEQSNLQTC